MGKYGNCIEKLEWVIVQDPLANICLGGQRDQTENQAEPAPSKQDPLETPQGGYQGLFVYQVCRSLINK